MDKEIGHRKHKWKDGTMGFPLETIIIGNLGNPNAQCQPEQVAVVHGASGCEANTLLQMKDLMAYNWLSLMEQIKHQIYCGDEIIFPNNIP